VIAPTAEVLTALLAAIREAGGDLRPQGDALWYRPPRLDPVDRAAVRDVVRRHKGALVVLLNDAVAGAGTEKMR
jgi:hypothetical protein